MSAQGSRLLAYFGYGSLVNRATLRTSYVDIMPARLLGYRRCWRPRPDMPGFPAALLTVVPDAGSISDGVLVIDHAENLAAVDAREARYLRKAVSRSQLEMEERFPGDVSVFLYQADQTLPLHGQPPAILRSYLDAVMQGFLAMHGEDGLQRFVDGTDGFDLPIHEDRDLPVYPRAVALSAAERILFDRVLARRSSKIRREGLE